MNRRSFIATSSMGAAAVSIGSHILASSKKYKIPQWRVFNLLDFFSPNPNTARPGTVEDHFKWMRDWGFDFVRIPMAYPVYLDIDRNKNITPEDVYKIDEKAVDRI